jgi:CheY-like chemotaxis protein
MKEGIIDMKVLIAEDKPILQDVVSEYMNDWGYDFDMASNGLDAVNLAKTNEGQYDICLMDIDMPVMNGCEATKEIRKKIKYFPIVAVSGNEQIGYKDVIGDNPDILNAGTELQIPVLEESLGYQLLRGIRIHAEEIKPILGLVKTQNIVYILRWYTISWYAYDVTVFWNSL